MTAQARYRSLFVLGRGGMGTVEAALEVDAAAGVHRVVALKRLLPDAARDKRRAEMFLREARVAALLDHPNVVRAFDYGEADGELYFAMEYVEGLPLSRLLHALGEAREKMPPAVAAWILGEVCRGLHAAHELVGASGEPLKLVHRDVSPQNVMLGYDGRVRLLDFGVAKIDSESVTKTGEVKGKTAYMSPEQAMGDPLDRRSDLFGIGAILFECVALRRMWGNGTDMDVIRRLALEEPPRLATAGDVPEALSTLHARLVARSVDDRPTDAGHVADEFARIAGDGEAAAQTLRELVARHFGEHIAEQRTRLSTSLHEALPEEAASLRASVLPPNATRARAPTRATSSSVQTRHFAVGSLAVALIAVLAWRATTRPRPHVAILDSASAQSAVATTATSAAPAPAATMPASPSTVVATPASASGSKLLGPPRSPLAAAPIATTTTLAAAPNASPKTAASPPRSAPPTTPSSSTTATLPAPRPRSPQASDVDEKPF